MFNNKSKMFTSSVSAPVSLYTGSKVSRIYLLGPGFFRVQRTEFRVPSEVTWHPFVQRSGPYSDRSQDTRSVTSVLTLGPVVRGAVRSALLFYLTLPTSIQ